MARSISEDPDSTPTSDKTPSLVEPSSFIRHEIRPLLKPHQTEGLRFMWDRLVLTGHKKEHDGLVLANRKGLGKTMEVIQLIVAMLHNRASDRPIPSSNMLRDDMPLRALILCCPGRSDHWMEELKKWVPKDVLGMVGPPGREFRKITSASRVGDRIAELDAWYESGGVMITSYQIFQRITTRQTIEGAQPHQDQVDFERTKDRIINGPNIVIADEAQKLSKAPSDNRIPGHMLMTKRRVALSSLPVAENLHAYHTMIEWVAPGMMEPMSDVRTKYIAPIEAGLNANATRLGRRHAERQLANFIVKTSPVVHICGVESRATCLPSKLDFIIRVPLTALQTAIYDLCVRLYRQSDSINRPMSANDPSDLASTSTWEGILSDICTHPRWFAEGLSQSDQAEQHDGGAVPYMRTNEHTDISRNSFKRRLAVEVLSLLQDRTDIRDTPLASFKLQALSQILDAARDSGDKVLVFSQSATTFNCLNHTFAEDGRVHIVFQAPKANEVRQNSLASSTPDSWDVCLVDPAADYTSLCALGANRVVVLDHYWDSSIEKLAIGCSFRLGQQKPVYVYRLIAGGTFEDDIYTNRYSGRQFIHSNPLKFERRFPRHTKLVRQEDIQQFIPQDTLVLGRLISPTSSPAIRSIRTFDAAVVAEDDTLLAAAQILAKGAMLDAVTAVRHDSIAQNQAPRASGRYTIMGDPTRRAKCLRGVSRPLMLHAVTKEIGEGSIKFTHQIARSLSKPATAQNQPLVWRRASAVVSYISARSELKTVSIEQRIRIARKLFEKYTIPTNEYLSGIRSLENIMKHMFADDAAMRTQY